MPWKKKLRNLQRKFPPRPRHSLCGEPGEKYFSMRLVDTCRGELARSGRKKKTKKKKKKNKVSRLLPTLVELRDVPFCVPTNLLPFILFSFLPSVFPSFLPTHSPSCSTAFPRYALHSRSRSLHTKCYRERISA